MSASGKILAHESGLALDLSRRELSLRGVVVPIGGRAFEILAVLAQFSDQLVGKDELMRRVWPGAVVEENTLQAQIAAIRRALGADRELLKTVSGRGYRLSGEWTAPAPTPPAGAELVSKSKQDANSNLPVGQTDLFGRSFASQHVERVLTERRAVTLTGPGGIGKTALALQVARSAYLNTGVDTYVVDFAPLSDPELVPSAVAAVLDVGLGYERSDAAAVVRAVGAKRLILVFDNCEHLIDAIASLAEMVLRTCRSVTILATSRENLRIGDEYVYPVGPLSVPTEQDREPDVILAQSAVQLFVARISAVQAVPSLDATNLVQIAAVCRRLDGIPLAIELAAARAATLGVAQVAARLDDRFGLLTAGRRTALPRHRTLRATLDWSYQLLPEYEQHLLRRTAIFPAGFTLEAAAAVDGEGNVTTVLDGIANLVAKSLLSLDGASAGGRWKQLETTRAYALERLVEEGGFDQVARLSASHFRDLFQESPLRVSWRSRSRDKTADRRELDNVRAAIDWALSSPGDERIGLELTADSAPLWFQLSTMHEYRQRVEAALVRVVAHGEPQLETRLQVALGHALWYTQSFGDLTVMKRAFARAAELATASGDHRTRLKSLWGTWAAARGSGDHHSALSSATQYELIADDASGRDDIILGQRMLALTHHDLGNLDLARQYVAEVLDRVPYPGTNATDDLQVDARVAMLTVLARVQWLQGFSDQAAATAREAIDIAVQMDHWFSICYVIFLAGVPVPLWVGEFAEAGARLDVLRGRTGGNFEFPGFSLFGRVLETIVRLRQGSEADALAAAYYETRVQYPTVAALGELMRRPTVTLPSPDDIACESPWSLPEVLRVDAELLLLRADPHAALAAETKLQRSLELSRQQGSLSWELRTATSFARLRIKQGRRAEARELVLRAYKKFTEGFGTSDLRSARVILEMLE